eukprot:TRINITY_DN1201_c0_g1_i1.p1 TRINITY_DN1201_c0_g1~~TRINITY_DN1201_c0_g1_i1.p1  ORF type:complete len:643 (+),score=150.79 TRINITY_DN1201_c0_g1_i1:46-1974(+)
MSRSRHPDTILEGGRALSGLFAYSPLACSRFVRHMISTNDGRTLGDMIFRCPVDETRRSVCQLLGSACAGLSVEDCTSPDRILLYRRHSAAAGLAASSEAEVEVEADVEVEVERKVGDGVACPRDEAQGGRLPLKHITSQLSQMLLDDSVPPPRIVAPPNHGLMSLGRVSPVAGRGVGGAVVSELDDYDDDRSVGFSSKGDGARAGPNCFSSDDDDEDVVFSDDDTCEDDDIATEVRDEDVRSVLLHSSLSIDDDDGDDDTLPLVLSLVSSVTTMLECHNSIWHWQSVPPLLRLLDRLVVDVEDPNHGAATFLLATDMIGCLTDIIYGGQSPNERRRIDYVRYSDKLENLTSGDGGDSSEDSDIGLSSAYRLLSSLVRSCRIPYMEGGEPSPTCIAHGQRSTHDDSESDGGNGGEEWTGLFMTKREFHLAVPNKALILGFLFSTRRNSDVRHNRDVPIRAAVIPMFIHLCWHNRPASEEIVSALVCAINESEYHEAGLWFKLLRNVLSIADRYQKLRCDLAVDPLFKTMQEFSTCIKYTGIILKGILSLMESVPVFRKAAIIHHESWLAETRTWLGQHSGPKPVPGLAQSWRPYLRAAAAFATDPASVNFDMTPSDNPLERIASDGTMITTGEYEKPRPLSP